jgi:hypothetical protein
MEIRAEDPGAHRIIWHDLEDERRAIEHAIPDCVTVYGSQDLDEREQRHRKLQRRRDSRAGRQAGDARQRLQFPAPLRVGDFPRHRLQVQGFHPSDPSLYRFLQTHQVRIDLIYTEAERDIRRQLERKWEQHNDHGGTHDRNHPRVRARARGMRPRSSRARSASSASRHRARRIASSTTIA